MANQDEYPEFLQETMFQEHGTKVLITNPRADQYLERSRQNKLEEKEQARQNKLKEKYPQWTKESENS